MILQGAQSNRTYTITLPKQWILDNHIDKTHEVCLSEQPGALRITGINDRIITVRAQNMAFLSRHRIIQAYVRGYDLLVIITATRKDRMAVREIISDDLLCARIQKEDDKKIFVKITGSKDDSAEQMIDEVYSRIILINSDIKQVISGRGEGEYLQKLTGLKRFVIYTQRIDNLSGSVYSDKLKIILMLIDSLTKTALLSLHGHRMSVSMRRLLIKSVDILSQTIIYMQEPPVSSTRLKHYFGRLKKVSNSLTEHHYPNSRPQRHVEPLTVMVYLIEQLAGFI